MYVLLSEERSLLTCERIPHLTTQHFINLRMHGRSGTSVDFTSEVRTVSTLVLLLGEN